MPGASNLYRNYKDWQEKGLLKPVKNRQSYLYETTGPGSVPSNRCGELQQASQGGTARKKSNQNFSPITGIHHVWPDPQKAEPLENLPLLLDAPVLLWRIGSRDRGAQVRALGLLLSYCPHTALPSSFQHLRLQGERNTSQPPVLKPNLYSLFWKGGW